METTPTSKNKPRFQIVLNESVLKAWLSSTLTAERSQSYTRAQNTLLDTVPSRFDKLSSGIR